jgi:PAS domain-containing protein
VPHITASPDGWVREANDAARALLGIDHGEQLHYSDFLVPDATEVGSILGDIISEGHRLSATVLVRPIGGDLIACEVRAERTEDGLQAWIRLADDVDVDVAPRSVTLPALRTEPAEDTVFGGYATRQLGAMAVPDPDALALRLRRLYPHARVVEADPATWVVTRDSEAHPSRVHQWWSDPGLPRVRYDDRGLILAANPAAARLLGERLVGRHWQELVIPGSEDDVQPVLDMLRTAGEAVSRFRMPGSDGRLVEFDSHTRVDGDVLETTMRPTSPGPPSAPQHAST